MVKFDDTLKDVDVLCGRGNGINSTPGNIRFRKLVDDHRVDYILAPRQSKVAIAARIINAVHDSGGKFLGYEGQKWTEVPMRKAIEKACQALREDAKNSRKSPDPSLKPTMKLRHVLMQNDDSSTSTERELNPTPQKVFSSTELKGNSPIVEEVNVTKKRSPSSSFATRKMPKIPKREHPMSGVASHDMIEIQQIQGQGFNSISASTPGGRTTFHSSSSQPIPYRLQFREEDWDAMYKILLVFRVAFGHTGVPPNWAGDPEFADWVSRQRQLYREVLKTGHRTASSLEHSRLRKLQNLDFVWEYDEWHWDKCYKDIQKRMQEYSAKYNNDANGGGGEVLDPMMPLPPSLQFWLNIQREVAQQNHDQLSDMKRKKLQSLIGSGWDEETEFEEEFLLI